MKRQIINLAFDFGASSGRAIISKFDGSKIELEEIHRFSNDPVKAGRYLYWDVLRLFHELKNGLKKAAAKYPDIASIGIDTWGVDYGLLDENDELISNPIHYRDVRTENMLNEIEKKVAYRDIYEITGIQYMALNTLYQLYSERCLRPNTLAKAKSLLFMPDLFNFLLTGKKYNEYTIASTSQMLDVKKRTWMDNMLKKLDIPTELFQTMISPGTVWGKLSPEVQQELELGEIPVVAVGSHDTASAVAGTPLQQGIDSAYLSSGTWSLLGIESDGPIVNDDTYKYNFTNEGGVEGKIRFLKNINGLWIIQQLRASWSERYGEIDFQDIIREATAVKQCKYRIDPNDPAFTAPHNMVEAIQNYCELKGQGRPQGLGEIAMAVYNGLTGEYKRVVEILEELSDKNIEIINMVGGGIKDNFLCQLTANSTGKRVLAGPVEASVLGNVVMQLMALGEIKSLQEGRNIIKNSFIQKEYIPS